MAAAELEQCRLLGRRHHPAGRVRGRVDVDRLGARRYRGRHRAEVEVPALRALLQPHIDVGRAGHRAGVAHVGPVGADQDHLVAAAGQALQRHDHRQHGRARDGDPVGVQIDAVEAGMVAQQRLAQGHDAARPGVEGAALVERPVHGLADEGRRDEVALAEPERDDLGIVPRADGDPRDPAELKRRDVRPDRAHAGFLMMLMLRYPSGPAAATSAALCRPGAGKAWAGLPYRCSSREGTARR